MKVCTDGRKMVIGFPSRLCIGGLKYQFLIREIISFTAFRFEEVLLRSQRQFFSKMIARTTSTTLVPGSKLYSPDFFGQFLPRKLICRGCVWNILSKCTHARLTSIGVPERAALCATVSSVRSAYLDFRLGCAAAHEGTNAVRVTQ